MNKNNPIFKKWEAKYLRDAELRYELIADFDREGQICQDYCGRELLEIIQNADDQRSTDLRLTLHTDGDDPCIVVTNSGADTVVFSEDGYRSIMTANMSSKKYGSGTGVRLIGQKGLGFRSLLNWATMIEIRSAGVHCKFAEKFAMDAWRQIERVSDGQFLAKCAAILKDANSKGRHRKCVVPILARPEVSDDLDFTVEKRETKIVVHFDAANVGNIRSQVEALTPQVLLFLKNLTTIRIVVDGSPERTLNRGDWNSIAGKEVERCVLRTGASEKTWVKFSRSLKSSDGLEDQISVAWMEDGTPLPSDQRLVYSFFPTGVRLDLPCILHATFRLNSSRDQIAKDPANVNILEASGVVLTHAAEFVAKNYKGGGDAWRPVRMIYPASSIPDCLCRLNDGIEHGKTQAELFPVVSGEYKVYGETRCYGERLAKVAIGSGCFANHLCPGFSTAYPPAVKSDPIDSEGACSEFIASAQTLAAGMASRLSNKSATMADYAEMLEAFMESYKGAYATRKFACLLDEKAILITSEDPVFVNSGRQLLEIPECVNIRYVNQDLVDCVAQNHHCDSRGVTVRLDAVASVRDSDVNGMMKRMVSFAANGYVGPGQANAAATENFKLVVKCLFSTYFAEKSVGMTTVSSERMNRRIDSVFKAIGEDRQLRPATMLSLWDEEGKFGLSALVGDRNVASRWKLQMSLQSWMSYLGAEKEDVIEFMCDFLGVSAGIPFEYRHAGDDRGYIVSLNVPNASPDDFTSARAGDRNLVPTLSVDFLSSFDKGVESFDMPTVIALICRDDNASDALVASPHVVWFKNKLHDAKADSSYMSYLLRKSELFARLAHYVVDRNLSTDGTDLRGDKAFESLSEHQRARLGLVMTKLGAAPTLDDLSLSDLYELIGRRDNPDGVQKFYRVMREAVLRLSDRCKTDAEKNEFYKKCDQYAKAKIKQLYARKGRKGEVVKVDRENVWYWDNDVLSRSLLDNYSKLEIGGRVGEVSVAKIFGVSRLENNATPIKEGKIIADCLTHMLVERLRKYRPYLMAVRFQDREVESEDDYRQAARVLKDLKIEIVRKCKYRFNDADFEMQPGDLLVAGERSFVVCSDQGNFERALLDPKFCLPVAEALCISFQLSGSQVAGGFRSILKNTEEENEFFREQEIDPAKWANIQKSLGLTAEEDGFWRYVFQAKGKGEMYQGDVYNVLASGGEVRTELLIRLFGEDIADCVSESASIYAMKPKQIAEFLRILSLPVTDECGGFVVQAIRNFVLERLCGVRDAIMKSFARSLHNKLLGGEDEAKLKYCMTLRNFVHATDWLLSAVDALCSKGGCAVDDEQIVKALKEAVSETFLVDISVENDEAAPLPIAEYEEMLHRLDLEIDDLTDSSLRSMVYFEGFEERFRQGLESFCKENGIAEKNPDGASECGVEECAEIELEEVGMLPEIGQGSPSVCTRVIHSTKKTKDGYSFGLENKRIGRRAERLVMKMMLAHPEKFLHPIPWSSISDKHGLSDDSRHYDFEYTAPSGEKRYLECKAFDSGKFLMSSGEYEMANHIDYKNSYDVALVTGRKVALIHAPFANPNVSQGIKCIADTYRIEIKL